MALQSGLRVRKAMPKPHNQTRNQPLLCLIHQETGALSKPLLECKRGDAHQDSCDLARTQLAQSTPSPLLTHSPIKAEMTSVLRDLLLPFLGSPAGTRFLIQMPTHYISQFLKFIFHFI